MSSLFDFDNTPEQYAVIGNPIAHSKSPLIHAEFARQTRQQLIYTAIQVDAGGLAPAVGNFQAGGGKGLNITVPFKRDAWELSDELSLEAERAGAVNTLLFTVDGRRYGHNTDGIGLVRDITVNHQGILTGKKILILGAGGAVRGILHPLLAHHPRQIYIANRTPDRAAALASAFSSDRLTLQAGGFADIPVDRFDLIINGTAASLHDELPPLPPQIIGPDSWCYDMMYGKGLTVFLQWARQQGADHLLDGLGMLVEQAAESFLLWRNVRPDTAPVLARLRTM
ncbi:MAG: shikimate dehydrogenase [Gammaproteobacteria bacterium]|nr:shikimate dehydrogenase [Gammaproteobacteria bacterium]